MQFCEKKTRRYVVVSYRVYKAPVAARFNNPSSGFLKRRIISSAGIASAKVVVELGPGNGGTTQALLESMGVDARLLCVELNERLCDLVKEIDDPRFVAHHGDACELESILKRYGPGSPDVVVSGIPFSTMDRSVGATLLGHIHRLLKSGV